MGIWNSIKNVLLGGPPELKPPQKQEQSNSFYIDTVEVGRVEKERFFRTSAYSPIENRASFTGLEHFPINPAYCFTLPLKRAAKPQKLTISTNTGEERPFVRLGTVDFEVYGRPARLAIYRGEEHGDLFVPFRDATSGNETYGAGRYLEPEEQPNGEILLDFNLAYNPFCAYSPHYSCPLPPRENHLEVAIRAGEKAYKPPYSANTE